MAEHITDPRVVAGMIVISSDPDGVLLTGSEGMGDEFWQIEFGVRDGKIYVVQDTGTHLSADALLAVADAYPIQ